MGMKKEEPDYKFVDILPYFAGGGRRIGEYGDDARDAADCAGEPHPVR